MINWGIIGCGDVTEVKSGPAFNKVPDSKLVAVMRRNADKAADYAKRHHVPKWYTDAEKLIHDPEVNAIYIATPPSSHETYALAAIRAGKPVYVEKPMALNYKAAQNMALAAAKAQIKLTVAHYRRQWPLFMQLKKLLEENVIGTIRLVRLEYYKEAPSSIELEDEKNAWRVNPAISGGGLFHDLAPHQLDILYYLFGHAVAIKGISLNQGGYYLGDDIVTGSVVFESGVVFSGSWSFAGGTNRDSCEIIGSKGTIQFCFFNQQPIIVQCNGVISTFNFDKLLHVQQPMIEKTVRYFLGDDFNPCSGEDGAEIMRWIDAFTNH